jgi:hypothetical protein
MDKPEYVLDNMQARAKEAAVKSNCHTVQLAAEDFAVQNDGVYAADVDEDRYGLAAISRPTAWNSINRPDRQRWPGRSSFATGPFHRA